MPKSFKPVDMGSNLQARVENLEAHTAEMSEGILQNNDVLKTQFASLRQKLDAHEDQLDTHETLLDHADQMGDAIKLNNQTLKDQFNKIQTKLDAHADLLQTHEMGLQIHHADLEKMAFDTGSTQKDALTFAPDSEREHLDIHQLNKMAQVF